MKQMKLSVIIPSLNAADTIATQLEALASQRWSEPWEVIISDNGSTDKTLAIIERYGNRLLNLHVVDSSDRRGAAHARNVGAQAATGDALAFCDADDEVASDWVAAIGEALREYDLVASRFDIEKLNAPWVQKSRENPQIDGLQRLWYPPYLSHASGSGLGLKRSLHEAVGGFDESFCFLEETDYCLRIQLAGVKIHFVPDAVVYYRYRHTFGGIFHQGRHYATWNVLLYKTYWTPGVETSRPWKRYVSGWRSLLRRLLQIRDKGTLARWVWLLGWRVGLLQGSIRYRVPPVPG